MSDDYDLQALVELRGRQRNAAQKEYGRAVRELDRRQKGLADKRAEADRMRLRRRQACAEHDQRMNAGGLANGRVRAFADYLAGLTEEVAQVDAAVQQARRAVDQQAVEVDDARRQFVEARRDLEAVEKHRDKWDEQQAKRRQRKRESANDDIAARRWMEDNG